MKQTCVGPVATIKTAQAGASMKSYGFSRPLNLQIEGLDSVFRVRPMVISGLSGQINIGSGFLTSISKGGRKVSISYTDGVPSLTIHGARTDMINNMTEIPVYTLPSGPGPAQPAGVQTSQPVPAQRGPQPARSSGPGQSCRRHSPPPPSPDMRSVITDRDFILKKNSLSFVPVTFNTESLQ